VSDEQATDQQDETPDSKVPGWKWIVGIMFPPYGTYVCLQAAVKRQVLTVDDVLFLWIALGLIGCAFAFLLDDKGRELGSLGFAVAGGLALVASALSKKN